MIFRVGQEVVCIRTERGGPPPFATVGMAYTISEVLWHDADATYDPGATLQFHELRFEGDDEWVPGFKAEYFRPVKTTSIEVFRQMLVNPPREVVDA